MTDSKIQKEISSLQRNEFLQTTDTIEKIKTNSYLTKIWADVFWRRRDSHKNRIDPEIPFIFEYNSTKILEIGAAYGRVLRKIAEGVGSENKEIVGIDVNDNFQLYFDLYKLKYPELQTSNILYDDFLTTSKLQNDYFDTIVLPMNTFPIVHPSNLETLFSKVKQHLKSDGLFIFSKNKFSSNKLLDTMDKSTNNSHSGDLSVELGNNPIAMEFYDFGTEKMEYGAQRVNYAIYNEMTTNYQLISRELYRGVHYFFNDVWLQEKIVDFGFVVKSKDNQSHSIVYVLSLP